MTRTFLLTVTLALIGLGLFLVAGFSNGHSALFNYPWTVQYSETFNLGTILPRHLPGLWSDLGGYDFFFYAPLPFWFVAAIGDPICIGCSPEMTFVLGVGVFWLLGAFTFFLFIQRYVERPYAILGAVAYSVLPYHLWIDWFVRQAAGEFAAYAFIPLAAFGFDAVRLNTRYKWIFPIGIAGVFLCHLPTALLAAHVFGAVLLVLTILKLRQGNDTARFLMHCIGWAILGVGLSAFYWLPAISLIDTVSPVTLYSDGFVASRWLFGLNSTPPNPFTVKVLWLGFLAMTPSILLATVLTRGAVRVWILVPILLAVFLNTQVSEFIWDNWIISMVQFPWRLMVFVDFSTAIAIALVASKLKPTHKIRVLGAFVLFAAVPLTQVGSYAIAWARAEFVKKGGSGGAVEYLSPEMFSTLQRRIGISDLDASDYVRILTELDQIGREFPKNTELFERYQSLPRKVTFIPLREVRRVSIPVQYWFLWHGELDDGTPVSLSANPQTGIIDVTAPHEGFQGRKVTLALPLHTSEKLGFLLTALSIIILAVQILRGQGHTKKQPAALPNRAIN